MTEETNQTTTDQSVAKELTQNEFWVSGMLNGTFYECDGPYYTTKDIPAENYPYTTIKPNPNFTSQKYDYINHKWVDTSETALLHEMESIKTNIKSLQQTATTLSQGFASQAQAQEAKDKETGKNMKLLSMVIKQVGAISGKIDETGKNMKLLSMVIKQVGAISDKIDGISAKLNENSAATPTATPTATTTQTATAIPAATPAADETKKEGTK